MVKLTDGPTTNLCINLTFTKGKNIILSVYVYKGTFVQGYICHIIGHGYQIKSVISMVIKACVITATLEVFNV